MNIMFTTKYIDKCVTKIGMVGYGPDITNWFGLVLIISKKFSLICLSYILTLSAVGGGGV